MLLASCGSEIKFHKWPSGDYYGAFQIPEAGFYVPSISWCNEGELLASTVPSSGTPIVVSVGQTIQTYKIIDLMQVQALVFSKTVQKNIMVGTEQGQVLLYDLNKSEVNQTLPSLPSGVKYLQYGVLDTSLAVGCKNGQICLYNSRKNVCATFCVPNSNSLTAMIYHPKKAHILAAASGDGIVVVWDSSTGNTKMVEKGHATTITDVSFSYGDEIVTVGLDHKFIGYDLRIKECIFTCTADSQLSAVEFMPNGDKIAVASVDGKLYCYDRRRINYPTHTIVAHHPKAIGRIAFQTLPFYEEPILCAESPTETQRNSVSNAGTVVYNPRMNAHSTIIESTNSACRVYSSVNTISADTDSNSSASVDGSLFANNLQVNAMVSITGNSNTMPIGLDYLNKTNEDIKPRINAHSSHNDYGTVAHLPVNRQHEVINVFNKTSSQIANPNTEQSNDTPAVLDVTSDFDTIKKDAIGTWIKKLPKNSSQDNVASLPDAEAEIGQIAKELVDVTKETVDRLTEMINKEFMRIRMALSRGFIHMEYKMNARWQEFNDSLMQLAGYELTQTDERNEEFPGDRNEIEDDQQQSPSWLPSKSNFNAK